MKKILLPIGIIVFCISSSISYSMNKLDEESSKIVSEKIFESGIFLTPQDLLSENVFADEKVLLVGTLSKKPILENLDKKIPNVKSLSLKFVNQPTFRTEENRQRFLTALKNLNKLETLSLENQFFTDDHLIMIPQHIKTLDLSNSSVLGYGLEYLPKSMNVIINKPNQTEEEINKTIQENILKEIDINSIGVSQEKVQKISQLVSISIAKKFFPDLEKNLFSIEYLSEKCSIPVNILSEQFKAYLKNK